LVDINRTADAPRDGADVHVATVDVPTVRAFGVSAAGEIRHRGI
jgi:hypothetical protein